VVVQVDKGAVGLNVVSRWVEAGVNAESKRPSVASKGSQPHP
jgi:hypothetical protein